MFAKSGFLFSSCIILLTSTCVLSQTQKLSSAEVLQRYRESLSYLQSVSMHIVVNVDSNDHELFPQTLEFVFRRDRENNRAEWLGKQLVYKDDGALDLDNSEFIKDIADGNMCVSLDGDLLVEEGDLSRRVILYYNYKERLKDFFESPNYGGPLFGEMYGNNYKNVADLLIESPDFHMHNEKENINGVACVVLEGTSKYGKVSAWIAPEKGYNAFKWVIEKDSHHLFDNATISKQWPNVEGCQFSFTLRESHEVSSEGKTTFVPKLAYFTRITNFRDGTKNVAQFEYKTSDIQLEPDFEALGAFKIDFPDGIRVYNRDFPSVRHTWLNGKPVPNFDKLVIKEIDDTVDEILAGKVSPARIPVKKTEAAPNEPVTTVDTDPDAQVDTAEAEREILSESRSFPLLVLIPIGLLIIAVIAWRMFLPKKG